LKQQLTRLVEMLGFECELGLLVEHSGALNVRVAFGRGR
jgi:hypothetical protein